jgi:3-methylcrotonyl-CoA carboxylase beta subunit
MKLFESKLDLKSDTYKQRRSFMLQLLSELNLRKKQVVEPSPDAVAKLQKRGKYPAREKIRRVLDPGEVPLEIGLFAAWDIYRHSRRLSLGRNHRANRARLRQARRYRR